MYQMIGGITTCTTTSSQVEEKVSEMIQGSKGGSTSRYRCIFTCFWQSKVTVVFPSQTKWETDRDELRLRCIGQRHNWIIFRIRSPAQFFSTLWQVWSVIGICRCTLREKKRCPEGALVLGKWLLISWEWVLLWCVLSSGFATVQRCAPWWKSDAHTVCWWKRLVTIARS